MKAWELGPQTGLAGLRCTERPVPEPGPGEVLVRVRAACLNHRDLLALRGRYMALKPETRVPGSDGMGTVEALGEGVATEWLGRRVTAPHFTAWIDRKFAPQVFGQDLGISRDGWLAEYVVLPQAALIAVPDSMSDRSAAALPVAGATVWHALVTFGQASPGDLILAPGTGGVSIGALQIGKALGCAVAITSSSEAKLARARELGADYTINYAAHPDWPAALLEATGGRAADVVVDTVGFAGLGQTIAASGPNARIALIGALSGALERAPDLFGIVGKNLTLKGITSGSRAMLADAIALLAGKGVAPVIDRVFPFDRAGEAMAYLESGGHVGKVLIEV